jgi:hypothetical protein
VPASSDGLGFRRKFLQLFGYAMIACALGAVVWGVLEVGGEMFSSAKQLRCQNNLKTLIAGLDLYRQKYQKLPPYLTAVLPMIENRRSKLICPADPDQGRKGCRPAWMQRLDRPGLFDNVNLDGPSLDADRAHDRFPCSYLYAANVYPCGPAAYERSWRDEFEQLVERYGGGVPLVRCYYHLPELRKDDPSDPAPQEFDPRAEPTYNITAGFELREYPLDWQSDGRFSDKQ